jgi:hypothetical protein
LKLASLKGDRERSSGHAVHAVWDRIRIEMFDVGGASTFGAIDEVVAPLALDTRR